MSTWGSGIFENDNAMDWIYELHQCGDLDLVVSTLEEAIGDNLIVYGNGFISTYIVDSAVAAVEVIAALIGRPSKFSPQDVAEWVQVQSVCVQEDIVDLVDRVVIRMLNTYELLDLWAEPKDYYE